MLLITQITILIMAIVSFLGAMLTNKKTHKNVIVRGNYRKVLTITLISLLFSLYVSS